MTHAAKVHAFILIAVDHALTDGIIPPEERNGVNSVVLDSLHEHGLTYEEVMKAYTEINDKRWRRIK